MGDEQHRQMQAFLQLLQQVDDLCLHGDVQGGDRLVRDEQLGLQGQRAGDADALALAAGKFTGAALCGVRRKAHHLQQSRHTGVHFVLRAHMMHLQYFFEHGAHAHARVQRGVWVLKYHLHAAARGLQAFAFQRGEIHAVQRHSSGVRVVNADDGFGQRAFAAAAFAHKAQAFAGVDIKVHAVHGRHRLLGAAHQNVQQALLDRKAQAQPAHLQQRLLCVIAVFHSYPPLGRGRPRNGSGRCGRGRPPARRETG